MTHTVVTRTTFVYGKWQSSTWGMANQNINVFIVLIGTDGLNRLILLPKTTVVQYSFFDVL